jgi:hypothetical protein
MAEACLEAGIRPFWIHLPTSDRANRAESDFAGEAPAAQAAGFAALSIENPYLGKSLEEVALNPWDSHPNAASHHGIAHQLFATLQKRQDALQLGLKLRSPAHHE